MGWSSYKTEHSGRGWDGMELLQDGAQWDRMGWDGAPIGWSTVGEDGRGWSSYWTEHSGTGWDGMELVSQGGQGTKGLAVTCLISPGAVPVIKSICKTVRRGVLFSSFFNSLVQLPLVVSASSLRESVPGESFAGFRWEMPAPCTLWSPLSPAEGAGADQDPSAPLQLGSSEHREEARRGHAASLALPGFTACSFPSR